MSEFIYFNSRDELLRVDTSCIVYFEASGNYTKFVLKNGETAIIGANLAKVSETLGRILGDNAKKFARIGKCYIINLTFIFRVNPLMQELVLSDQKSFSYTLNLSKEALKNLRELITTRRQAKTKE